MSTIVGKSQMQFYLHFAIIKTIKKKKNQQQRIKAIILGDIFCIMNNDKKFITGTKI
jgi:hypothetical protein